MLVILFSIGTPMFDVSQLETITDYSIKNGSNNSFPLPLLYLIAFPPTPIADASTNT